jgi:hypothetical protein
MRISLRPRQPDTADQITALTERNRSSPERRTERQLLALRHQAGTRLLDAAPGHPSFTDPEFDRVPAGSPLPELEPGSLSAGIVRAAILRDGCALVRGLVPREVALDLAAEIDRAYTERQRIEDGGTAAPG